MTVSSCFRIGILLIVPGLFCGACSDTQLTAEEQLRNLLQEAEKQLEARDLNSVMAYVDPAYSDNTGRDFRALKSLLFGYFLRHKSIHVLSKINQFELVSDEQAVLVVFAGVVGSPEEAQMPLADWRGDLLRLQLHFVKNSEAEWLLQRAEWRRATPQDFDL